MHILVITTVISTLSSLNHPIVANPNLTKEANDFSQLKIETWQGKLIYQEILPIMSQSAYEGAEFFLITNSQSRLVLRPSEKVSRSQLLSFHNQQVKITAVYVEGTRPAPDESACPIDGNGQCIAQGSGYQVLSIKSVIVGEKCQ